MISFKQSLGLIAISSIFLSFSACKRGFELDEPGTTAGNRFVGPTQGASWELTFNSGDERYTLKKRAEPDSTTNTYELSGDVKELSSGYYKFDIESSKPDAVKDDSFFGIRLGKNTFILRPVENASDDLIPLVNVGECRSSDYQGNAFFLERVGDATSETVSFLGELRYDVDEKKGSLNDGIALDDSFKAVNESSIDGGDCADGIVKRSSTDLYVGGDSAIVETDNGGYSRIVSIKSRSFVSLDRINGKYLGFLHRFSGMEDLTYVTASCTDGTCNISRQDDPENPALDENNYDLKLVNDGNLKLNTPLNGLVKGTFAVGGGSAEDGNAACFFNEDIDSGGKETNKVLVCNAQATDDNTKMINLILVGDK